MNNPFFLEFVVKCPQPVVTINQALLDHGFLGGYDLGIDFPSLQNHMLVAVTEMISKEQIDAFVDALKEVTNV